MSKKRSTLIYVCIVVLLFLAGLSISAYQNGAASRADSEMVGGSGTGGQETGLSDSPAGAQGNVADDPCNLDPERLKRLYPDDQEAAESGSDGSSGSSPTPGTGSQSSGNSGSPSTGNEATGSDSDQHSQSGDQSGTQDDGQDGQTGEDGCPHSVSTSHDCPRLQALER